MSQAWEEPPAAPPVERPLAISLAGHLAWDDRLTSDAQRRQLVQQELEAALPHGSPELHSRAPNPRAPNSPELQRRRAAAAAAIGGSHLAWAEPPGHGHGHGSGHDHGQSYSEGPGHVVGEYSAGDGIVFSGDGVILRTGEREVYPELAEDFSASAAIDRVNAAALQSAATAQVTMNLAS